MLSRFATTSTRRLRQMHTSAAARAKVVCVLYDDPATGFPPKYARDSVPEIKTYPGQLAGTVAQTAPTPSAIEWQPGQMLGCVSGELGLREYLEKNGHTYVVTSSKDGP